MGRPARPNPYTGERKRTNSDGTPVSIAKRAWHGTHVKQETKAERKARLRAEAERRDSLHELEGSPRSKAKRLAKAVP